MQERVNLISSSKYFLRTYIFLFMDIIMFMFLPLCNIVYSFHLPLIESI